MHVKRSPGANQRFGGHARTPAEAPATLSNAGACCTRSPRSPRQHHSHSASGAWISRSVRSADCTASTRSTTCDMPALLSMSAGSLLASVSTDPNDFFLLARDTARTTVALRQPHLAVREEMRKVGRHGPGDARQLTAVSCPHRARQSCLLTRWAAGYVSARSSTAWPRQTAPLERQCAPCAAIAASVRAVPPPPASMQ